MYWPFPTNQPYLSAKENHVEPCDPSWRYQQRQVQAEVVLLEETMAWEFSVSSISVLVYTIIFLSLYTFFSAWFYKRRELHPIKERSPKMVLTMNALIMIAVVFLCIMRMSPESTPCWATLWGGYVGSVALCNGMCGEFSSFLSQLMAFSVIL